MALFSIFYFVQLWLTLGIAVIFTLWATLLKLLQNFQLSFLPHVEICLNLLTHLSSRLLSIVNVSAFWTKLPRLKTKTRNQPPWLNQEITLKRKYSWAERTWTGSSKLTVHFNLMKDLLRSYIKTVKVARSARSAYFSKLISANHHHFKFLFDTINCLVNPVKDSIPPCIGIPCFL